MEKNNIQQKKKYDIVIPLLVILFISTTFLLFHFGNLLNRSQKHNSDEIELISHGYNVLHANDQLIKLMKIYVLNHSEKYRKEYIDMINDYDSFYGRLGAMRRIGLTESETEKANLILDIWEKLEKIESEALEAIDNGDYETAVSIIYGDEYAETDDQLVEIILNLVNEIAFRGRITADRMNRQIQITMFIFSFAFLVILIALAFVFRKNNRLKDLYKTEKQAALRAAIEAEQSSNYKSSFLATMSHEIRTPMNAILGIAEIQMQNEVLSKETEEAFSKIYESGNLLLHIINDILDLSKIEAGKLELVPVDYDIPSLINDIVQINRLRYESKPIEFILKLDENIPLDLFGDELRIKQVLNNVLSNAFKYTEKGEVTLSVSADYDREDERKVMLIFRVIDTGQGMTEDQVNRLFSEYTRFNLQANRTTVGTGLGMSIAKRLVVSMDGNISVESKPGEGSVFTVQFPQKCIGNAVLGAELVSKLQNFNFQSTSLTKKVHIIRDYMPYGSVLVVDDVESNIFVARGMLAPYGLKFDAATSGFEAIEKIKNGNVYDIIFMDHMMPKMDGIETTKVIRETGYKNYIVALTANAIVGQSGIFLKNGFDGYISKPVDSRELNFILNDLIRDKKPPEVVEAARKEQKIKEKGKRFTTSEIKRIFAMDAEKAIDVLRCINRRLQDSKDEQGLFNKQSFYGENDPFLEDEDLQSYIITVHGMKSALANIGEAELSDVAIKLEKAGHNKDFSLISNKTSNFINALQLLVIKYKSAENDTTEEISVEDLTFLKEKMLIIKSACETLNGKEAKYALNELKEKAWPGQIRNFIDDIGVFLLHSDFDKAALLAENIIKQTEENQLKNGV